VKVCYLYHFHIQ